MNAGKTIPVFLEYDRGERAIVYGNRNKGSFVNVANPYRFSYPGVQRDIYRLPGYCGESNDHIPNKNENVLEFINQQKGYKAKSLHSAHGIAFPIFSINGVTAFM